MEKPTTVLSKLKTGSIFLIGRQVLTQGVSFIAAIYLARTLSPADFGIYVLLNLFTTFLTLIADGGIGSSIIQRKGSLESWVVPTTFVLVQLFYGGMLVVSIPLGFIFIRVYSTILSNMWLVAIPVITFYLTSFRTLPAAVLERNLNYKALASVESLEVVTYQLLAVIFAHNGFQVWSFLWSAFISRLTGLLILNYISFDTLKAQFRVTDIKLRRAGSMLKFGLSLQSVSFMSFLRDSVAPTIIAMKLGSVAVGYVNFAKKLSTYPTLPTDFLNRMIFPVLSRLQGEDEFNVVLGKMIGIFSFFLLGGVGLLTIFLPETIRIVYSAKWLGAINVTYSYLLIDIVGAVAWPLMAALKAKGRTKEWFLFETSQFIGTWVVGIPLILVFGLNGWTYTLLLIQVPAIVFIVVTKRILTLKITVHVRPAIIALGVTVGAEVLLRSLLPIHSIFRLGLSYIIGALIYTGVYIASNKHLQVTIYEIITRKHHVKRVRTYR